jgi:FAD/FMN-containing dehydrogenase
LSSEKREDAESVEERTERKVVIDRVILREAVEALDKRKDMAVAELTAVLGEERVSTDPVDLKPYGKDFYTPVAKAFLGSVAEAGILVLPATTEEVAAVVRVANKYRIPVTPFALGTNMASNTIASSEGAMIMDLRLMRGVKVSPETQTATIQPAVSFGYLQHVLDQYGLKTPLHIGGGMGGFIGNWVSSNVRPWSASGMSDPVVTAEIVLPTGEIMRTGSQAMKNEAYKEKNPYVRNAFGPDIVALFKGSIGAFGIITSVTLRCYRKGEVEKRLKIGFEDLESLIKVSDEIQYNRIGMASLGMDRETVFGAITTPVERKDMTKKMRDQIKQSLPEWILVINLDGTKEQVEAEERVVEKILVEYGGKIVELSELLMERLDDYTTHRGGAGLRGMADPTSMVALWCQIPREYLLSFYNNSIKKMKELDIRHPITGEPYLGRWFFLTFDRGVTNLIGLDVDFTVLDEESFRKAKEFLASYLPIMENNYGVIPLVMGPLADLILMPSYTDLLKALKKLIDHRNIMNPHRLVMGMENIHLTAEIAGYRTGLKKAFNLLKKALETDRQNIESLLKEAMDELREELKKVENLDETHYTTSLEGYQRK